MFLSPVGAPQAISVHIGLAVPVRVHGTLFNALQPLVKGFGDTDPGLFKVRRPVIHIQWLQGPGHDVKLPIPRALPHDIPDRVTDLARLVPIFHIG